MKKIILITMLFASYLGYSQGLEPKTAVLNGAIINGKTSAAIQALAVAPNGYIQYSTDTETLWLKTATGWVDTGTSGTDDQTLPEVIAQGSNTGAITTTEILDGTILGDDIAALTIDAGKIQDNSVTNNKLSGGIAPSKLNGGLGSEGQVIKIVGGVSSWAAESAGSGTIGGSIADNQIAIGATTANSIEGLSTFIYNPATGTLGLNALRDTQYSKRLDLLSSDMTTADWLQITLGASKTALDAAEFSYVKGATGAASYFSLGLYETQFIEMWGDETMHFLNQNLVAEANLIIDGDTNDALLIQGQGVNSVALVLDASVSAPLAPVILGAANMTLAGQGMRFQFGDAANVIENQYGNGINIKAYNTMVLSGGAEDLSELDFTDPNFTQDVTEGLRVNLLHDRQMTIRQSNVTTRTSPFLEFQNNAGTILAGVNSAGQFIGDGSQLTGITGGADSGQGFAYKLGTTKTFDLTDFVDGGVLTNKKIFNSYATDEIITLPTGLGQAGLVLHSIISLDGAAEVYLKKGAGTTLYLSDLATAVPDDGIKLIGGFKEGTLQLLPNGSYKFMGEATVFNEVVAPAYVYAGDNAIDPNNELNNSTGIAGVTNATISVSATDPQNGIYSAEANFTAGSTSTTATFVATGVNNGDNVSITFYLHRDANVGGNSFPRLYIADGWVAATNGVHGTADVGVWTPFTLSGVATMNNPTVTWVSGGSTSTINAKLKIDNVVITIN
tara:strand:+ start:19016 stop:21205 length:2190 start_codon:yes stop_codon:yes gene_type:complete